MIKKISLVVLVLFVSMTFASAVSDIAYIYRKDFRVDHNIIGVFGEMSLTVDLINERDLPADLSSYRAVFIGDERLRKAEEIKINNFPSIIASYHHGNVWGITDRDGVSQLGATSQLMVVKDSSMITAYTQAFIRNTIAVPYYFLDGGSKNPSLTQIAATQTTSSGYKFGDVVAYAEPGDYMLNGEIQRENLCFFGIVKSDYWTPESKQLFKDCVNFAIDRSVPAPAPDCCVDSDCGKEVVSERFCKGGSVYETVSGFVCEEGSCISSEDDVLVEECLYGCELGVCLLEDEEPPIVEPVCSSDYDCPGGVSSLVCGEDENVYENLISYTCENPGEFTSRCVMSEDNIFVEGCYYGCMGGVCLVEPEPEDLIHDVSLVDFADSVGGIKLTTDEGEVITDGSLMCGGKYKIIIKIENNGNFTENVTFEGLLGDSTFSHVALKDFVVGDSKTKTRTITLGDEVEGTFDLSVRALLESGVDFNDGDNFVSRSVDVVCVD